MIAFDLATGLSPGKFAAAYFAGILTSLTPCVYPILPIVLGYLGAKKGPWMQRMIACSAYAIGLAIVYTALGIFAGISGQMFGDLTSNWYIYLGFGIFMLYLGGSMMDWYQIPLPGFLQQGVQVKQTNSVFGPLLVGMASGLVASPCTAPVVAGILGYIASEKAVVSGGLLMLTFSLGMNTVLLLIGLSMGSVASKMPKSGKWMLRIKSALAFLIIAAGLYFVFKSGQLS